MEDCREGVRTIAGKLKKLLDDDGRTYRGLILLSLGSSQSLSYNPSFYF